MLNFIDSFLNRLTMFRLTLYLLIIIVATAEIFAILGMLPISPINFPLSIALLVVTSLLTNSVFAGVFGVRTNPDSVYITALILSLIISPFTSLSDLLFIFWAAVLANSSKYILALKGKHIFNPAAISVVLTAFVAGQSASWWVGNLTLMPLVIIGGLLIMRRIRKTDLIFYFLLTTLFVIGLFTVLNGHDLITTFGQVLFHSSLFFFAFIMLTEPLTTPPTAKLQSFYGAFVGILFVPDIHLFSIYSTPELALVIGNLFSYIIGPKFKLLFTKPAVASQVQPLNQ